MSGGCMNRPGKSVLNKTVVVFWVWLLAACSGKSGKTPWDEPDAQVANITVPEEESTWPCLEEERPAPVFQEVEVSAEGFRVNGRFVLLRGGTLQWFRLPRGEWEDRLRRFRAAGFNTVDVYVPWNVIEPAPGQFETEELTAFLDACARHGLYVYFRPGPYICNEMDGGGLPAWLVTVTSKKSLDPDGRVNLRTRDPDFLAHVEAYFSHLNAVILPYLVTRGGPVILYGIENEYNWFELFAQVDKLAWYDGGTERPTGQDVGTTEYLSALRDMVLSAGVDVPIATCPGDSKISGMGEVTGVLPMPNMYLAEETEKLAYDVVTSMHDPGSHGGRHVDMPSGTTESERKASRMVRTFFGGMDAYFAFNIAGMHTPDRHNALVLHNAGLQSVVEWTPERVLQLFVSPTIGYFHNVIDYYGAIGPAGTLREKFYHFRRKNQFFDLFEERIAPLLHPLRSGGFAGADPRLQVDVPELGAKEGSDRVHYWFLEDSGTWFVQLLNEGTAPVQVDPHQVSVHGVSFPRYTTWTIPVESHPGNPAGGTAELNSPDSPEELHYSHIAVGNWPLAGDLELTYSTAEILTRRRFNDEDLLVLYGPAGTEGELALRGLGGAPEPEWSDPDIVRHTQAGQEELILSWTWKSPQVIRVRTPQGHRLLLWLLDTDTAGKLWFFRAGCQDAALAPLLDLQVVEPSGHRTVVEVETAADTTLLTLFTGAPAQLNLGYGAEPFDPYSGRTVFALDPPDPPVMPPAPQELRSRPDPGPRDAWIPMGATARPLEFFGIHKGSAWIRARVTLPDPVPNNGSLYVEHASDIVSVYVNGNYVTTVCPVGTEIDNKSWSASYQFKDLRPLLVPGENEVLFQVEIWGHGSFMWPRGRIIATNARIPSLGFDAFKGVWGEARLAGRTLGQWEVQAGSAGENQGFFLVDIDENGFVPDSLPMTLEKGEKRWVRLTLPKDSQPSRWRAPGALRLSGMNARATIWFNGNLVGRWLSDEDFLQRGAWTRALRDMWMNTPPDEFPLASSLFRKDGGADTVVLLLEDASSDQVSSRGHLTSVEHVPFGEEKGLDDQGRTVPAVTWRHARRLVFAP